MAKNSREIKCYVQRPRLSGRFRPNVRPKKLITLNIGSREALKKSMEKEYTKGEEKEAPGHQDRKQPIWLHPGPKIKKKRLSQKWKN